MGWLVLRWQNMTSVHFYCLLTFIFMLKSCGVVGGSIWIIKSALVLLLSFDLGDGLDNFATEMKCYVKSIT